MDDEIGSLNTKHKKMNVKKRYLDTKRVRTVKRKKEKLEGGISVENMINQERRNLKKINNEI